MKTQNSSLHVSLCSQFEEKILSKFQAKKAQISKASIEYEIRSISLAHLYSGSVLPKVQKVDAATQNTKRGRIDNIPPSPKTMKKMGMFASTIRIGAIMDGRQQRKPLSFFILK